MHEIVEAVVGIAFVVIAGITIYQAIQKKEMILSAASQAADFIFLIFFRQCNS